MSLQYLLGDTVSTVVAPAIRLLDKIAKAPFLRPAQAVSVAKLRHVLGRLPRASNEMTVSLTLNGPTRILTGSGEEHRIYHWWDFQIEGSVVRIGSGGHFYRKSTGGDSFSSMRWEAMPGEEAELNDYLGSLGIVDDAQPYADEVDAINLSDDGYELSIEDKDNPLLEDPSEEEDEGQDVGGAGDVELPDGLTPAEAKVLAGADLAEAASRGESNINPPDCCDVCGCELASRSVLIDGRLRGSLMFATMCADCFLGQGEGIGWGSGQAYLRQPDGTWLMVAGFRPND